MRTLIALLVVALSGCASIGEYRAQKQLLLAPAPLNSPQTKAVITGSYNSLMQAAQNDPKAVPLWIDAGIAVNVLNCSDWLGRVATAKRNVVMTDHELGVASSLATTLMGIAKASSTTVAVTGALGVAAQGVLQNVQTDLLLAPSAYQVQTTLMGLLGSCNDQLRADARGLSFGQAFTRLETCSRVCSFEAASAASTNALTQTVTTVNPTSGALTTTAVSSTFAKDDSSARIIAFWMTDGRVNQANDARLKVWMKEHGVDASIPFLAHSKLYEAARKQAVADLGIPEAK